MPNTLNLGIFNKHCYSILSNLHVKLELKDIFNQFRKSRVVSNSEWTMNYE